MSHEKKARRSKRLKAQQQKTQPQVSFVPSKRAHLAQKSLYNSEGEPTGIEVVLPPLPSLPLDYVLYCGPEPDYEAVYFSLYDKLAWDCHTAEKTGRVDSVAFKEKAKLILQAITKTIPLTNNQAIRDVFSHLAQLISDHFMYPTTIKLKHVKRFLVKLTTHQQEMADDDLVLPLISALEKLSLHKEVITSPLDIWDDLKPLPLEDISFDELEEESLPDEFPAHLFPDAPKVVWVTRIPSYTKITATLEKTEVTVLKRPESPNSDETLSPTPSHYELTRVHELGLRKKARVDYREDDVEETPQLTRNIK